MKASSLFSRLRAVAAKSPFTPVCQVSTKSAGAFFVLAFALLAAGISTPTASAQAVTYAGSGAVNFGSVNVCPSGVTGHFHVVVNDTGMNSPTFTVTK